MSESVDFIVNRSDLRQTAIVPGRDSDASVLVPGQVLLRVDRFALTANNVTYGAVGDLIGYWSFFPARDGWGRIPVWGFADVVRSECDKLAPGERFYGYFPMSTHVVVQPEPVSLAGFIDAMPHRAELPPIYNQYTRVAADPGYERALEAQIALFRPLFTTAFLLDDFFADNGFFGARSMVLTSASSKTALGLAFLMSQARKGDCEMIGLTSAAHQAFVESTGYYDLVFTYDDLRPLAREMPAVLVDFAGNAAILAAAHRELDDSLKYSCSVGVTHWEKMAPAGDLPGPAPILFFAPEHARRRMADWGAAELQTRVAEALRRFLDSTTPWLRIVEGHGVGDLESVYRAALEGKMDPSAGHVLSL